MGGISKHYQNLRSVYCQGCGREAASLPVVVQRWGRRFLFCSDECGRAFEREHQDYGDYFDSAA
jgi:hypothetical protein